MAKATRMVAAAAAKRQGRRVMPKVQARRAAPVAKRALTLGDLVAAAFEAAGNEVRGAARILSSNDIACATGKRIVLV